MAERQKLTPGPDHPITIRESEVNVRVVVGGKIIANTTRALVLEEMNYGPAYYIPRDDADMGLLERTTDATYCPYKGNCHYYSIPSGGAQSERAVWTYEESFEAVASIKDHLDFYPDRVDSLLVG